MNALSIPSRSSVRISGSTVTPSFECSTDWKPVVASYITGLDVRESSRELYKRTLSQFFFWVNTGYSCPKSEEERKVYISKPLGGFPKPINALKREDILEYKDHLLSENMSALTVGSYLVAVRKFYDYLEANSLYPNIARGVKSPKRKNAYRKQHLTDEKSTELLSFFEERSLRDYAIVNLLLRTGLRTIEVTRADIQDITFKGGQRILKVWGKGRDEKDEFVVLTDKVWNPIFRYLDTCRRGAKGGDPLFVSFSHQNRGERLTTKTVSSMCKEGLKAVGLDGREFTAHSLRHTTAVAILKRTGDITKVQKVLRHTSPVTTQIYTASIDEELRLQNPAEALLDSAF